MPTQRRPGVPGAEQRDSSAGGSTGHYYIVHGDDELAIAEELAKFRRRLGKDAPAMGELNTNVFDGRQVTFGELRHACDSTPFMEDRRLVIVRGLLDRLAPQRKSKEREAAPEEEPGWKRAYIKELTDYLPSLPATTRLVFVEGKPLEASHPILKFAVAQGKDRSAHVIEHRGPKEKELTGWIEHRVRSRQGSISREAADLLGGLVGRDLRLLDLEIDKLLLYTEGRQVATREVKALVSQARDMDIFELVDCVGRREADRALQLLHGLLAEGKEAMYLLGMLARQVRILIQVGELSARGLAGDALGRQAGLHPFVASKAVAQLSHFSISQLEAAHQQVLETDWSIKMGDVDEVLALDLMVVRLCSEPAA